MAEVCRMTNTYHVNTYRNKQKRRKPSALHVYLPDHRSADRDTSAIGPGDIDKLLQLSTSTSCYFFGGHLYHAICVHRGYANGADYIEDNVSRLHSFAVPRNVLADCYTWLVHVRALLARRDTSRFLDFGMEDTLIYKLRCGTLYKYLLNNVLAWRGGMLERLAGSRVFRDKLLPHVASCHRCTIMLVCCLCVSFDEGDLDYIDQGNARATLASEYGDTLASTVKLAARAQNATMMAWIAENSGGHGNHWNGVMVALDRWSQYVRGYDVSQLAWAVREVIRGGGVPPNTLLDVVREKHLSVGRHKNMFQEFGIFGNVCRWRSCARGNTTLCKQHRGVFIRLLGHTAIGIDRNAASIIVDMVY